ncbi:MAG TPA: DNA mismatch repair protein MutS [Bdellovibrionales bacterium]|nr:DNA mismatch repair protein MutS [Bdellovibrionales bacterium]
MQQKMTPLMQQYWDIKSQHTDKIVMFRMGDFFEMFHQDAETAAPILNIALTQRNKKSGDDTKMCGMPHHSIAGPIAKLLTAGHKVAICDQIEDPALAKGLVKRAVTRVLTPGMVYDPDTLDQLSANYLCAYDERRIAFADITTGEAFVYDVAGESEREELLTVLAPRELVLTAAQWAERRKKGLLTAAAASEVKSLAACTEALKEYIKGLQGEETLQGLAPFEERRRQAHMRLSATTIRHLEIFENARGGKEGTLFAAVNRTQTWAGGRLLKTWLASPLMDEEIIRKRQDEVAGWLSTPAELKEFRQTLSALGDIERRLGKVHSTTFNARDLMAIAQSIQAGFELSRRHPEGAKLIGLSEVVEHARTIERALNDELPIATKEGGMIRQGFSPELDELIALTRDSQQLLLELEEREKAATGIGSLKVRYNNVFGFYIELTKTHSEKAPKHYRRKQTLTNAERFTTDELDRLEEKVLSARAKRDVLEYEIFAALRKQVIAQAPALLSLARAWTAWDVLSSFAWLASERRYARPRFAGRLHLELSRHPVVEQTLGGGFVPNSLALNPGECLLLTGPNMAGKSTLMRQVALNAILAQIGAYVPSESAELPIFDEIFTRVGASDALNDGLSTFMVEMTETAEILKRVNSRSLVVMDEIGRGTSTYDGLSLAQAILEFLVSDRKPYMLFATHYHELTGLAQIYPQIHNGHMSVQEKNGQIQFLHSLVKGPANRSYGIHVAKLAGLPGSVTQRAQTILKGFEGQTGVQLSFADMTSAPPAWIEEVRKLDLSGMTPLEALNKLHSWQREGLS